ncbi:tetratricopeptide repeat protein [Thermoproteota archaeon]
MASVVAERYIYLPSIFFSILVAFLYERYIRSINKENKIWVMILCFFIISAYAARTVARNEDLKSERQFWKTTLESSPNSPNAHNMMGVLYLRDGNIKRAISEFNIAMKLNPRFSQPYNNLGTLSSYIGEAQAINYLQKAIELDPNLADAHSNLGILYKEKGRIPEAMDLYHRAIELDPTHKKAYMNLGNLYMVIDKHKEAIELYKKALEIDPNYTQAYFNLGVAFNKANSNNEAIYFLNKALKTNPLYLRAYSKLGEIYINMNKNVEAIALFKEALKVDPKSSSFHFNLARLYFKVKEYNFAVLHCDKAKDLGYRIPSGFLNSLHPYRERKK